MYKDLGYNYGEHYLIQKQIIWDNRYLVRLGAVFGGCKDYVLHVLDYRFKYWKVTDSKPVAAQVLGHMFPDEYWAGIP